MAEEIKNEETVEEVAQTEEVAEDAAKDAEKTAKKAGKKKKWPIVVGVVAVVLVAAGAGFWVWHEQPSFCNAICHTPMDAYYETYADGSTDKYGNELDEAGRNSMMAYLHVQTDGTTCMDCHVPSIGEQITEGMNWVTGNYEIEGTNALGQAVMPERALSDLTEARGVPEDEFCLNSGCHTNDDGSVMTRDDLIEATADLTDSPRNPHLAQHGERACSDCHKAHSQSVNYCTSCHNDAPVPEGWLTMAEAKKLHVVE